MSGSPDLAETLLVVDDDSEVRGFLRELLSRPGRTVVFAETGAEARETAGRAAPAVVLLDIGLPDESGLRVLKDIVREDPKRMVIMMTGLAEEEVVVEAMREGAMDYVVKPLNPKHLRERVEKAFALGRRNRTAAAEEGAGGNGEAQVQRYLIGSSPAMVELFKLIGKLAGSEIPVLVTGESGTGKELVARALHRYGPRSAGPFVPVDCGSVPATLLEAELFGYEKGAFTDAAGAKPGRFEQAHGGTLFLDEIGNIPMDLQVKLLRALQEKTTQRLGSTRPVKWDARIVSATNAAPRDLAAQGRFRSDLLFRISGAELSVPPLRERISDLPLLVGHFLAKWAAPRGNLTIEDGALEVMARYSWPGNIRELEHAVDRAAALVRGTVIGVEELPAEVRNEGGAAGPGADPIPGLTGGPWISLEEMKRRYARHVLEASGNNKAEACRILKIDRKTLNALLAG